MLKGNFCIFEPGPYFLVQVSYIFVSEWLMGTKSFAIGPLLQEMELQGNTPK